MTKHYALSAETRDRAGKGVARALRREAKIPAVIYGDAKDAETIALPVKEVTLEYQKGHMFTNLCDLTVGGKKQLVLVLIIPINIVRPILLTTRKNRVDLPARTFVSAKRLFAQLIWLLHPTSWLVTFRLIFVCTM